jgi:CRP/FNR family transcriptional regulator, transcriptional activator FtrB
LTFINAKMEDQEPALFGGSNRLMRLEEHAAVRQLALFSGLADETYANLMQAAYLQTIPRHVQLITEGESADFLYIVVEGLVELFAESNGRETTLKLASPLSTFILAAVLKDAVYLASARTIKKSQLLLIPAANVRDALDDDVEFSQLIVRELASDYRGLMKALKGQKLRSTTERLANYILQQRHLQGGEDLLMLPHDKKTLASFLGMTPENLSRAFGGLRKHGIEVNNNEVRIKDLNELEYFARPSPLIDDDDL